MVKINSDISSCEPHKYLLVATENKSSWLSHKCIHKSSNEAYNYKYITEYQNIRLPEQDNPQYSMYHLYI